VLETQVAGFNLLNYSTPSARGRARFGVGGAVATAARRQRGEFESAIAKTVQAALGTAAEVPVVSELENDGYGATSAMPI